MANRLDVEVSVGETVTTTTQLLTVIDEDVPIFFKNQVYYDVSRFVAIMWQAVH